jgi:glutamyl-tRNA reductase
MAQLTVIGLNHRTAPVEVRERLALDGAAAAHLLRTFKTGPDLEEAVVLSTCNRTELYAVPRRGRDPLDCFLSHLAQVKNGTAPVDRSVFYRHEGTAAAQHLFRVAAALDSQIVGEHQILGQVKMAYAHAVEARTAGFLLSRLMHWSFRVGKRVQTETQLGRGSAGVATAAVELARHIFSTLDGHAVLLVGAGQNAECAAKALLRAGASRLIVANRTLYRAQQLAYDLLNKPADPTDETCDDAEVDAPGCPAVLRAAAETDDDAPEATLLTPTVSTDAVSLDDLATAIESADLVITSTGSQEAVLGYDALASALARRQRPLFIVDIAVPRDVDSRLGGIDGVFLYNIDDLGHLVERNLERRRAEIPRAETIIEDEVARFEAWLSTLQAAPTIRLLTERFETLRQAHVNRYGRKFKEVDREQLEQFTRALGSQFLHRPVDFLKAIMKNGETSEGLAAIEMIRRLFGLDEEK